MAADARNRRAQGGTVIMQLRAQTRPHMRTAQGPRDGRPHTRERPGGHMLQSTPQQTTRHACVL
eukprot:353848-Chlamydomonas_euryale.AAC.5